MLFTSYEFLGFMVLLLIVYYLIPGKYQWPLSCDDGSRIFDSCSN